MRKLEEELEKARTDAEILEALSRLIYKALRKANEPKDCPASQILSPASLEEWLPECPPEGHEDLVKFLNRLGPGDGWEARWVEINFVRSGGTQIQNLTTKESVTLTPQNRNRPHPPGSVQAMAWVPKRPESGVRFGTLRDLHEAWLEIRDKHPVAGLVRAWQTRPQPVEKDRRDHGILPQGLFPDTPHHGSFWGKHQVQDQSELPSLTPGSVQPKESQLPLFPTTDPVLDRPFPLRLADTAGFSALCPGRGARLDKRLLIRFLLTMPLSQRRPGGRYTLRLSVRELIRELWNPIHYRPSRHGRRLLNGLEALYHARVELPDGSQWVPAVVRLFPNPRDWDSQVIVELALPEESDRGPLIYRPQLRRSGLISDPAYDLWLSLAYYWDRAKMSNGGYRIYATRPKAKRNRHGHLLDRQGTVILGRSGTPVTNWTHSRAVLIGEERHPQADKVSLLSPKMIRQLAFGPDPAGMSKSLKKKRTMTSRRLIQSLEKDGLIVIEEKGPVRRRHWRILEVRSPPDRATP